MRVGAGAKARTALRSGWPLAWLAVTSAITWSVVRFELVIVGVLTAAAVLLAPVVLRGARLPLSGRWWPAAVLVGVAGVVELVPSFTYTSGQVHRAVLGLTAGTAVLAAIAWAWGGPRGRGWVPWIATGGYLASAIWVIRADRAPRIDVWVSLQQASDGLARGLDAYTMTWHDSPGVRDAFTYWPSTLVLLAPGRWLAGDVRWALVLWTLVGAGCVLALGRGFRPWVEAGTGTGTRRASTAGAAVALLLLTPGTPTQVEQAWTEPLLFALLACWALLVSRGRACWAVLPLALALASKQHMVLLLPLLAVWPAFGWRRTASAAGLAGAFALPWVLASPSAIWHDTVTLLIGFHPILFADTLTLAWLHERGSLPPFWLTGVLVLSTVAAGLFVVRRRPPDLGGMLRWFAFVLLVANLVNKQAFYNQFWLVCALVLASVAAPESRPTVVDREPHSLDSVVR